MGIRSTPALGLALAALAVGIVRGNEPAPAKPSIFGGLFNGAFASDDAAQQELPEPAPWTGDKSGREGQAAKPIRRLPPQPDVEVTPIPGAATSEPTYDVVQASFNNERSVASKARQDVRRPQSTRQAIAALYDDSLLTPDTTKVEKAASDNASTPGPAVQKPVSAAFDGVLPPKVMPDGSIPVRHMVAPQPSSANGPILNAHFFDSEDNVDQPVPPIADAANPFNRPKIIFQPVIGGVDNRGNAVLRPDVQLAGEQVVASDSQDVSLVQYPEGEMLPPPEGFAPEAAYPVDDEWMAPVVAGDCGDPVGSGHHPPGTFNQIQSHLHGRPYRSPYPGVGREYVMHAPFFVDTTQPYNNCRIRTDYAHDWEFPDRAEYFWARTPGGKGPGDPTGLNRGETRVNHQEINFYIERGTDRISVGTHIPIRAIDPEYRLNTTGLADMEVTQKLVFLDGCRWQLTQIMSTHLPTGSFKRGTGNGHVSLEPGFAWRYKWHENTYLHGDLTYWFPIAADPFHSGQILNHGIGISHVWIDADDWALIPTFEVDAWTVLDGNQTIPNDPFNPNLPFANVEEIDSLSIVNLYPGLRWVCDKGGDCSTKEFGISTGTSVTEDHWYRGILRLEFRWSR